jgi:hypothetical protein
MLIPSAGPQPPWRAGLCWAGLGRACRLAAWGAGGRIWEPCCLPITVPPVLLPKLDVVAKPDQWGQAPAHEPHYLTGVSSQSTLCLDR